MTQAKFRKKKFVVQLNILGDFFLVTNQLQIKMRRYFGKTNFNLVSKITENKNIGL